MADLEGGVRSLAFASGMAATHCVTMLLKPGDHLVAGTDLYGGSYRLFHTIVRQNNVDCTLAPADKPQELAAAFRPETKLLWLESPGNPLMSITDIAACVELAHARGVIVGVDVTFATPALTRPLELGADIAMHSATKYIGGHSDLVGGVLTVRDERLGSQLYGIQNTTGAVMGPLEAFLCSRGLKTLELRIREQSQTALRLAQWLQADPRVERVLYPGLPDHPGHEIALRQMDRGFGAMITFEVKGGLEAGRQLVSSTKLCRLAVSLGAVESLIEQPASMSHASYERSARLAHGITDGLIRLSVGLEAFEDLQADLDAALAQAAAV